MYNLLCRTISFGVGQGDMLEDLESHLEGGAT